MYPSVSALPALLHAAMLPHILSLTLSLLSLPFHPVIFAYLFVFTVCVSAKKLAKKTPHISCFFPCL